MQLTHSKCPYRSGYETAQSLRGKFWLKEAQINNSHGSHYILRALGFNQGIREQLIQQKLEGQNQ